jgi:hypothetical protein
MDPMLSLAISIQANRGCYALLLGSGVSRSARIPTGWDVIVELTRRLARLRKEDCEPDPAAWFKTAFGKAPDYADLLDQLAKSPAERSQLLRPFFEPTEEEREAGLKVPAPAHRAIAAMARGGFVRVILTTNFDKLIEKALEEASVTPQVIASPDAAEGALPLTHAPCTVVKLHGDYLDTRIKNTPCELADYDDRINRLLDQVFDEYGLVVCGWSAEWDTALLAAVERCKGRRFTTYWATRGRTSTVAQQLIDLRRAEVLTIRGADEFFSELEEKVSSLEAIAQPHPLSAKAAIATLKRYVVDEGSRIRLHDLIQRETEQVYAKLNSPAFLAQNTENNPAALGTRLGIYNATMETLLPLMIHGCYWGNPSQVGLWVRLMERMASARAELVPFIAWPDLRLYPALLLLYGGGLGAVAGEHYGTLHNLLEIAQARQPDESRVPVAVAVRMSGEFPVVADRIRPGVRTADSDYLHAVLREPLRDIEPSDQRYEMLFDRFECLAALTVGHIEIGQTTSPGGRSTAPARTPSLRGVPMPIGRFGWRRNRHTDVIELLKEEQKRMGVNWPPLKAGLFGGDPQRFLSLMGAIESRIAELLWL